MFVGNPERRCACHCVLQGPGLHVSCILTCEMAGMPPISCPAHCVYMVGGKQKAVHAEALHKSSVICTCFSEWL